MNRAEIERVLEDNLSVRLPAEEVDKLVERIRQQEEQAALLRALPLQDVEPACPPAVEESL